MVVLRDKIRESRCSIMQETDPVKPSVKDPRLSGSLKSDKPGNLKPNQSPKRSSENPYAALSSTSGFSTPRDDSAVKILETKSGERILLQGADSRSEITSQRAALKKSTPDKHLQVGESSGIDISSPKAKSYSMHKHTTPSAQNVSKGSASHRDIQGQTSSSTFWQSTVARSAIVLDHSEDEANPITGPASKTVQFLHEKVSTPKKVVESVRSPPQQDYLMMRNMVNQHMVKRARQVSQGFMNALANHLKGDLSGIQVDKVCCSNNTRLIWRSSLSST